MGKKAEYRSAIRSRKLIREAFLKLLNEKDLQKITVTDIVTLADINRATFYAHYPDVRGVVEEIENEIIDKMLTLLREFDFSNFFYNPTPLLLQISRYLEEDVGFYRTLIMSNGADQFMEKLKKIFANYMNADKDIPKNVRNSAMFSLRVCYFAGGITNMYNQWFRGKLNCSLNDISVEVGNIIRLSSVDFLPKEITHP